MSRRDKKRNAEAAAATVQADQAAIQSARAAIEAFVAKNKAQLWIQHDAANSAKLKKAPQFYD